MTYITKGSNVLVLKSSMNIPIAEVVSIFDDGYGDKVCDVRYKGDPNTRRFYSLNDLICLDGKDYVACDNRVYRVRDAKIVLASQDCAAALAIFMNEFGFKNVDKYD